MTITETNPREGWLARVAAATTESEAMEIASEHPEWCPPGLLSVTAAAWKTVKGGGDCSEDLPFAVVGEDGKVDSCHATQAEASARCTEIMGDKEFEGWTPYTPGRAVERAVGKKYRGRSRKVAPGKRRRPVSAEVDDDEVFGGKSRKADGKYKKRPMEEQGAWTVELTDEELAELEAILDDFGSNVAGRTAGRAVKAWFPRGVHLPGTNVRRKKQRRQGSWEIEMSDEEMEEFDALLDAYFDGDDDEFGIGAPGPDLPRKARKWYRGKRKQGSWSSTLAADPGKEAGGGGATFVAVLALQGVPTSDGRMLSENMRVRDLPIPLMIKFEGSHGNDMPAGSQFAGRIEEIEVIDRRIWGKGTFDTSEAGKEAQRHVADQMLRWVSVDLGAGKNDITHMVTSEGSEVTYFDTYEVMAATMVATPAFQDAVIWLEGAEAPGQASKELPDEPELTAQEPDLLEALLGSAGEIPVVPPRSWFECPTEEQLRGAGGCFVTDEGRIFGTIHVEDQCHVGSPMGQCITVAGGSYQNFMLNQLPVDDGTRVMTGPLLFAPDHAETRRPDGSYVNAATAMAYYSNVGVAKADVACGDTEIDGQRVTWYSGALRPDISSADLRTLHGSVVSGDWRPIGGKQEMISLMAVNAPGFPQLLAPLTADGELMAVIASASGPAAGGCENCGGEPIVAAPVDPVERRLAAIEDRLAAIYLSVAPMREQAIADLEARIHPV